MSPVWKVSGKLPSAWTTYLHKEGRTDALTEVVAEIMSQLYSTDEEAHDRAVMIVSQVMSHGDIDRLANADRGTVEDYLLENLFY